MRRCSMQLTSRPTGSRMRKLVSSSMEKVRKDDETNSQQKLGERRIEVSIHNSKRYKPSWTGLEMYKETKARLEATRGIHS